MYQKIMQNESIKIGYELGNQYYEIEGTCLEWNSEMVLLRLENGEEIAIRENKIVMVSKKIKDVQEPIEDIQGESLSKYEKGIILYEKESNPTAAAKYLIQAILQEDINRFDWEKIWGIFLQAERFKGYKDIPAATIKFEIEDTAEYKEWDFPLRDEVMRYPVKNELKAYFLLCFSMGKYQKAMEILLSIQDEFKNNIRYQSVVKYLRDCVQRSKKIQFEKNNTYLNLGIAAYKVEKQAEKAEELLRCTMDTEDDTIREQAIYHLIQVYREKGDWKKAATLIPPLFKEIRKIKNRYDQRFCWMLCASVLFRYENWTGYSYASVKFVESVIEHPMIACWSGMKYAKVLEEHGFLKEAEQLNCIVEEKKQEMNWNQIAGFFEFLQKAIEVEVDENSLTDIITEYVTLCRKFQKDIFDDKQLYDDVKRIQSLEKQAVCFKSMIPYYEAKEKWEEYVYVVEQLFTVSEKDRSYCMTVMQKFVQKGVYEGNSKFYKWIQERLKETQEKQNKKKETLAEYVDWQFDFDDEVEKMDYLDEEKRNRLKEEFNRANYKVALKLLMSNKKELNKNSHYRMVCQYVQDVVERAKEAGTIKQQYGVEYTNGIRAMKIEHHPDRAYKWFTDALNKGEDTDNTCIWGYCIYVYLLAGNVERASHIALEYYDNVLKMPANRFKRQSVLYMLGAFGQQKMWKYYVKVLNVLVREIDEGHPVRQNNTILKYTRPLIENGRYSDAKKLYEFGLTLQKDHPELLRAIQELFEKQGEADSIEEVLKQTDMEYRTQGVQVAVEYMTKHESVFSLGDKKHLLLFYEKILSYYSELSDVENICRNLDKLYFLYEAAEQKEKMAQTAHRLAGIYYQQEDYRKFLLWNDRANENGLSLDEGKLQRAKVYIALQKYDEAKAYMTEIINSDEKMELGIQYEMNNLLQEISETKEDENGQKRRQQGLKVQFAERKFRNYYMSKGELTGYSFSEKTIGLLCEEAKERGMKERASYFQTAAYIENRLNGESERYYKLLADSVTILGDIYQNNRNYDSAVSYYVYALNSLMLGHMQDQMVVQKGVCAVCHEEQDENFQIISEKELLGKISNIITEGYYKELLMLLNKSRYLKELMKKLQKMASFQKNWLGKLAKFMNTGREDSKYCKDVDDLLKLLEMRWQEDDYEIQQFVSKIYTNRVFETGQLEDLQKLQDKIFVLDTDRQYLKLVSHSYEKALDINRYRDYENRMTIIHNVQEQFARIKLMVRETPTYFSINYLLDILDEFSEMLRETERKTRIELKPELSISIPVTDIPVVNGKQIVSVTISNKENAANAKNLKIAVYDLEEDILSEQETLAEYLLGGRSIAKEVVIPSYNGSQTIRVEITYTDTDNKEIIKEKDFSISNGNEEFIKIENPYYDGEAIPVSQKRVFVGRDELLDRLEDALKKDRSSCEIIYGQKRCGKSSVANFLEERMRGEFIVLKFSVGAIKNPMGIYRNVKDLLIQEMEDLIYDEENTYDLTEELLDKLEDFPIDTDEDFVSFMRFVRRKVCRVLDKEILLMIDEFTHIYRLVNSNRQQVLDFMDTWKKLLEAKLFKAVLIGQDTMPDFIKEFQNQFQVTQPIRVDRLPENCVRELIEKPILMPNGESRFLENSVEFIASLFYGQPFYIQTYCKMLVNKMNEEKKMRVTNAFAEKVKEKMLEEADISKFNNLTSKGDETESEKACYEILKQIAGLTKNSEWANISDINLPDKDRLLEDLVNRAVIKRQNGRCKILIQFFVEWLNRNE